MKKVSTSWGSVADWYDELLEGDADSYQNKVLAPNLLRIIDPKPDLKILDVACGQGYFSRLFASQGARVIGCDVSPELIEIAKKAEPRELTEKIQYMAASSDNFLDLLSKNVSLDQFSTRGKSEDHRLFDVATIILALQNIEDLSGTFEQIHGSLKKGGKLIIVMNHPAFRIPGQSSWGWDSDKNSQYRRIDSYMSEHQEEIDMTPGEKKESNKKYTISFHRPLQYFFKALAKNNFAVTRLEEWISHKKSQKGPRATEEDRMRKEIPMFICLEAVKN